MQIAIPTSADEQQFPNQQVSSTDLVKLIRKLRWIGMEEEALRLQRAVRSLPPEERGTVSAGPFSTD
jgi:hypothetical protein